LLETLRARPEAAVLVVEDGAVRGGFGQALAASLGRRQGEVALAGYRDEFLPHGTPASLEQKAGVSSAALMERIRRLLEEAD
jgi:deoxyxylulose-5-phosphate synthase